MFTCYLLYVCGFRGRVTFHLFFWGLPFGVQIMIVIWYVCVLLSVVNDDLYFWYAWLYCINSSLVFMCVCYVACTGVFVFNTWLCFFV